jgi:hypothetical protein
MISSFFSKARARQLVTHESIPEGRTRKKTPQRA